MGRDKHEGSWVWYDLNTTDVDAAMAFYGEVVGWKFGGDGEYREFEYDGAKLGGFTALREDAVKAGVPPHWSGYIAVGDIHAAVARVVELGGSVLADPFTMEGVGTFAAIADPTGGAFSLYQSVDADSDWEPYPGGDPGGFIWHELYSTDPEAAWAFYEAMFGWEKSGSMDMGEMGTYQMYAQGGVDRGALMRLPEGVPMSMWAFYVTVDDVEAAAERIKSNGGTVTMGPHDVPGGRIVVGRDPQGATFALHMATE